MNRKVLFRGKRIHNNEWIYGHLQQYSDACDIESVPVHPETVGQYVTDDRWGEPIYEGDLIWTDFKIHGIFTTEHKTGEVLWSTKRQAFLVKAGLTAIPIGDIIMSESKIEVRGNVYD